MTFGDGSNIDRVSRSVWMRISALVATIMAPIVLSGALAIGWTVYSGMNNTIDKLADSIDALKAELVSTRLASAEDLGEIKARVGSLESFTRDGGRYTQEEASRDIQLQSALNARISTLIEQLDERLRALEKGRPVE
jgi:chorismate mutase